MQAPDKGPAQQPCDRNLSQAIMSREKAGAERKSGNDAGRCADSPLSCRQFRWTDPQSLHARWRKSPPGSSLPGQRAHLPAAQPVSGHPQNQFERHLNGNENLPPHPPGRAGQAAPLHCSQWSPCFRSPALAEPDALLFVESVSRQRLQDLPHDAQNHPWGSHA